MILALGAWRMILMIAGLAVMGAKDDLRPGIDGRRQARGAGGGMVDATKVERRQQQRQQSREGRATANRAPPRLRQSASGRQGHIAPPGAIYAALTQSPSLQPVNILDELSVYDWLRTGRKTKLARFGSISGSSRHSARVCQAS